MTKKRFFLISILIATLSLMGADVYAAPVVVNLQVGYDDPEYGNLGQHKSPPAVPEIGIEDYTLTFYTPCDGSVLRLLDENDNVVYSTVIPTGTTSLVLPSYLSGSYEIQIVQGNIYFYGIIYL